MQTDHPIIDLIRQRRSCRTFDGTPIGADVRRRLVDYLGRLPSAPFGASVRIELIAAAGQDGSALRGLGTYGFIKGATGFLAGAVGDGERNLEDFGYLIECAVLAAGDLGLGTCWLGGTFTRSRFARRLRLGRDEQMPCVIATGHPAERASLADTISKTVAGAHQRLPWGSLFVDAATGAPLGPAEAGGYAAPLEMVRLGPSAQNRQPWRVMRDGSRWHFFLRRSGLLHPGALGIVRLSDLPRVDLGIAMCHWELTCRETGLEGEWAIARPPRAWQPEAAQYVATWLAHQGAGESRL